MTQAQMRLEAQVACRELHTDEGYIPERIRIWRPFLACRIKLREVRLWWHGLREEIGDAEKAYQRLCDDLASRPVVPAPLTGSDMQISIAKCVGRLQRAQNDPRLSTIRKWRQWTELLGELVVETHGALLARIRELEHGDE